MMPFVLLCFYSSHSSVTYEFTLYVSFYIYSRTSVKSADRPKERPPLPPIQLVSGGIDISGAKASYHDDLSDMPCTPPPPVPQSPIIRLPHTPSIDGESIVALIIDRMLRWAGNQLRPFSEA